MRPTRIIIITALAVGLAVLGGPAAGAAASTARSSASGLALRAAPVTPTQPTGTPSVSPPPPVTYSPQPTQYVPLSPSLTADRLTAEPGQPVTLSGTNWPGNGAVRLAFTLNPALLRLPAPAPAPPGGTGAMVPAAVRLPERVAAAIPPISVTADGAGRFAKPVTFADAGTVLVTATSLVDSRQASLTLTIVDTSEPPSGPGGMPVTGSRLGPQLAVGVAAILAGALL
ncbi:hypothetical protein ACFQ0D_28535, partial [Micromonospora zhanjiangensis]